MKKILIALIIMVPIAITGVLGYDFFKKNFAHVHGILNDDGEKIIPYIRSSNVGNTFIDTNELMRISEKAHSLLPLSQTRLHDIMMARKGKIGGASIITQDEVNYNCNQNVIKLTINEPENIIRTTSQLSSTADMVCFK